MQDVFVDSATGVGYMIYSQFHLMFIEQLSPDMLHGTGIGADIPGGTPARRLRPVCSACFWAVSLASPRAILYSVCGVPH